MPSTRPDGYPAFPTGYGGKNHPGMTLRDYFAAAALMGANASPALFEVLTSGDVKNGSYYERLARSLYRQADAMLAERNKDNG